MTIESVIVIAKQPLPGRVKTRLIGDLTPDEAAELASASLRDTLTALADFPCTERVLLLDGEPGEWLPDGWRVLPQADGALDRRLAAGFAAVSPGPALLVGMDTPQVTADHLPFEPDRYDACLGLATDGGYWAIGLADPTRAAAVIEGVPMSRPDTGAIQYRRLRDAGMTVQLLAELTDVDTPATAASVAAQRPDTGFARRWQELMMASVR
jgi:glycosyltransferase A (GT-A) superfamily protein (DUF2064 family)